MASPFDPYRVLGLPAGASAVEIKRAYRRLAKAYHPDSAGPAATPRFLAIQEAYDALTSDGGRGFGPIQPTRNSGATRGAAAPGSPASGGGARRRGSRPSQQPGPAPFGSRRSGPTGGTDGMAGGEGTGGRPQGGWWQRRPGRAPNRAILGSTTYDDAGEPEPAWEGAGWYGQATGTYWTINPREYADPRKHGPEYQARARRLGGPDDSDSGDGDVGDLDEASAKGDGSPDERGSATVGAEG